MSVVTEAINKSAVLDVLTIAKKAYVLKARDVASVTDSQNTIHYKVLEGAIEAALEAGATEAEIRGAVIKALIEVDTEGGTR